MTEQQDYTDRLEALQELMEAEEWEKVIFDCQSLLQLLRHSDDDESERDAALSDLLLEIQAKSFLKMDEWQEVIDLAAKNTTASILQSLAAYAQYRLGNYAEAKQLAALHDNDDLPRHVLAQSMYRLGQTIESGKVYADLLSSASNEEEKEGRMQMLTNALAVRNANAHPIPRSTADEDTTYLLREAEAFLRSAASQDDLILYDYYDLAYNLGTLQILMGQAADGRATLQAAERVVQDEYAGDDAEACDKDIASIQINLQWSLLLQGETSAVVGTKRNDFVSKLNSGNKTIPMKDMPATMTPLQRRLYHYNQAILSLKSKSQGPLVKLHCMSLLQSFNTKKKNGVACTEEIWWKSRLAVLEAQVMEQQQKPQDAKKHLQQQLNASSSDDAATAWLKLHIARLEGKLDSSSKDRLAVLESLPPSIVQSRAVVATRAALYQAAGENVPADLFSDDEQDAADFMLSQGNYEKAAAYFSSQTDALSRAKYALCLSYSNPQEALKVWKALGIDEDDIVAGVGSAKELTGEELEQLPLPRVKAAAARAVTGISNTNSKRRNHDAVLARRAKQRESYLASQKERGLDTTRAPNPERWIPKYERSKNRKRGQHKGAQGGFTEKDAAKYDVAARQANGGVVSGGGPSTAHIKVVSDSGTGGGRRGGRRR